MEKLFNKIESIQNLGAKAFRVGQKDILEKLDVFIKQWNEGKISDKELISVIITTKWNNFNSIIPTILFDFITQKKKLIGVSLSSMLMNRVSGPCQDTHSGAGFLCCVCGIRFFVGVVEVFILNQKYKI